MMATRILQGCAILAVMLVLAKATTPSGNVQKPIDDKSPPKYEYGYVVSDQKGGTQGHVESRDGVYALGRYYVNLPNGSEQKVTYFADDWGYHPLVSYTSTTASGTSRIEFAMGDKATAALKESRPTVSTNVSPGLAMGVQILSLGSSGHSIPPNVVSTTPEPVQLSTVSGASSPSIVSSTGYQSSVSTEATPSSISTSDAPLTASSGAHSSTHAITESPSASTASRVTPIIQQYVPSTYDSVPLGLAPFILHGVSSPSYQNIITPQPLKHENVHIVTPSSIDNPDTYLPSLDHNSIITNDSEGSMQFTHKGQNIKITSYLADTNKVLYYGDRIGVKEQEDSQELKLINEIQEHAKQRIFQDLQTESLKEVSTPPQTFTKPIVVSDQINYIGSSSTEAPVHVSSSSDVLSKSVVSYSSGQSGYNNIVQSTGDPLFSTQSTTLPPSTSINTVLTTPSTLIDSNSLAEKSDYSDHVYKYAENPVLITPRPNEIIEQLAPLQAGISILSAPEAQYSSQNVAPVVEENNENTQYKTEVDIQEGVVLKVEEQPDGTVQLRSDFGQNDGQPQPQQYQGLGYERRLVSPEAQQVVQENDPIARDQKQTDFLIRQQTELEQTQESIQELQQKIINEIDAHHEAEQRKQEIVHEERNKHLESLQKIEEIKEQQVQSDTRDVPIQSVSVTPNAYDTSVPYQDRVAIVTPEPHPNQIEVQISNKDDIHHEEVYNNQEYLVTPTAGAYVQDLNIEHQQSGQPTAGSYVQDLNIEHQQSGQPIGGAYEQEINIEHQQVNIQHQQTGPDVYIEDHKIGAQELSPPPIPPSIVEVEKPVPTVIETTKVVAIEKPIVVKEPVPIEQTKVVEVEKPVPLLQPYPIEVTKLVHVDRPVAVPAPYAVAQPVPIPFAVPHAVGVPVPHLIPYPEIYPIPYKEYHPVYIHKPNYYNMKPSIRLPDPIFKEPAKEIYAQSHYYHTIPLHLKFLPKQHHKGHYSHLESSKNHHKVYHPHSGRNKNVLKNLRIEYGFKPPLKPSLEIKEEPEPSIYGPSVRPE